MAYDPWKMAKDLTPEDLERLEADAKNSDPSKVIPADQVPKREATTFEALTMSALAALQEALQTLHGMVDNLHQRIVELEHHNQEAQDGSKEGEF